MTLDRMLGALSLILMSGFTLVTQAQNVAPQPPVVSPVTPKLSQAEQLAAQRSAAAHTALADLLNRAIQQRLNMQLLAFSADGKVLAVGDYDGVHILTQPGTQRVTGLRFGFSDEINVLALSPDGWLMAAGSEGRIIDPIKQSVRIWDIRTGKLLRIIGGHHNSVVSLAFDADGKTLASGDKVGLVKLWDVRTGHELLSWRIEHPYKSAYVSFTPPHQLRACAIDNGDHLWAGMNAGIPFYYRSTSKTVELWDVRTHALLGEFGNFEGGARGVALAPDGITLVCKGPDEPTQIWNTQTGVLEQSLTGLGDGDYAFAFFPDSKTVIGYGAYGSYKLQMWDIRRSQQQPEPAALQ